MQTRRTIFSACCAALMAGSGCSREDGSDPGAAKSTRKFERPREVETTGAESNADDAAQPKDAAAAADALFPADFRKAPMPFYWQPVDGVVDLLLLNQRMRFSDRLLMDMKLSEKEAELVRKAEGKVVDAICERFKKTVESCEPPEPLRFGYENGSAFSVAADPEFAKAQLEALCAGLWRDFPPERAWDLSRRIFLASTSDPLLAGFGKYEVKLLFSTAFSSTGKSADYRWKFTLTEPPSSEVIFHGERFVSGGGQPFYGLLDLDHQ